MKFFHVGISVKSLKESQRFFEEVFDFHLKEMAENDQLKVKIAMLENKSGSIIELFEHSFPQPLNEDLMNFQQIGIKHIAFAVDNIEEVMDKAIKNGAKVIWPIREIKGGATIKRLAFIKDPNGIPIELAEIKD